MALTVGSRLGHYGITALIGEGGMGQVYQATDTNLDRQVAIKLLPDAFAGDGDRLARFEREAKVLASLNHPNIGAIYGLEKSGDTRALVLELVEGPTLADRIKQGPIPVDEALPIAKQIAEALEAAHEAGVIHRDLKPANIKVREDGTVKVLDFGLAKAMQPDASDPNMSQSPTISLTGAATQMGMVIGTAAYMAPEQASGKVVDKRADVWALGAVLYEMLTGARPFVGDDVSKTLAHVIAIDPDWSTLPKALPPVLNNFLRGCLEKDPRKRIRDIGDVRLAMEGAFDTTVSAPAEPVALPQPQVWQRPAFLALAALVLVAATGVAVWTAIRPALSPVVRFTLAHDEEPQLFIATRSPDVAISPGGEHIAYMAGVNGLGAEQLRVRALDRLTSEALALGELNSPFFSPDGTAVGFYDRRGGNAQVMLSVSVLGGPVSTICDLQGDLRGASWGTDGTIVFGSQDTTTGLWRVAAVGGEPELLTTPDSDEIDHLWPELLPDDESVVFTVLTNPEADSRIEVLSLDTRERKVVLWGGGRLLATCPPATWSTSSRATCGRWASTSGRSRRSVTPFLSWRVSEVRFKGQPTLVFRTTASSSMFPAQELRTIKNACLCGLIGTGVKSRSRRPPRPTRHQGCLLMDASLR